MKNITTLITGLLAFTIASSVIAADQPQFQTMRTVVRTYQCPTNGNVDISGPTRGTFVPQVIFTDVGRTSTTNTLTTYITSKATDDVAATSYSLGALTAQVNGAETPIALTNTSYAIRPGEVWRLDSDKSTTSTTGLTYRVVFFEIPDDK